MIDPGSIERDHRHGQSGIYDLDVIKLEFLLLFLGRRCPRTYLSIQFYILINDCSASQITFLHRYLQYDHTETYGKGGAGETGCKDQSQEAAAQGSAKGKGMNMYEAL